MTYGPRAINTPYRGILDQGFRIIKKTKMQTEKNTGNLQRDGINIFAVCSQCGQRGPNADMPKDAFLSAIRAGFADYTNHKAEIVGASVLLCPRCKADWEERDGLTLVWGQA